MTNQDDLYYQIEALLFAYGDFLSIEDLMNSTRSTAQKPIQSALKQLQDKYKENHSFHLMQDDAGRWKMGLKEDYEDLVSTLISGTEIPQAALKVLSVIAYEQPVTKTRLNEILGKSVKQELDYLVKAKFLSSEKHGIGRYYRVTKKFFDYFKIDDDEGFREQANKKLNTFLEENSELGKEESPSIKNLENK